MLIWACYSKFSFSLFSHFPRLHFIIDYCFTWSLYSWGQVSSGKSFLFCSVTVHDCHRRFCHCALESGCSVVYVVTRMLFFLALPLCLGRQAGESNLNYNQSQELLLENFEHVYWMWHLLLAPAFNWGQIDRSSSQRQRFCCLTITCVCKCACTQVSCAPSTLKLLPSALKP